MDTFILDVSDIPARNPGEVMCQLLSSQLLIAYFRNGLAIATVEARRQSQRQSEQSTVALRKHSEKTFRGNTLISFGKEIVSDSPCIPTYTCNHSIRHSAKPIERNISKKVQSHSRSANPAFLPIEENISDRKALSFSHTLFLWLWAFSGKQTVSSRLHFTLDKTALTCCIHSLKDMHTLQSAAIRSSCTQSLGVDFSPTIMRFSGMHRL